MANMSYCRFSNTSNDLFDCIAALTRIADEEESWDDLSHEEQQAALKMRDRCEDFIDLLEEIQRDISNENYIKANKTNA